MSEKEVGSLGWCVWMHIRGAGACRWGWACTYVGLVLVGGVGACRWGWCVWMHIHVSRAHLTKM